MQTTEYAEVKAFESLTTLYSKGDNVHSLCAPKVNLLTNVPERNEKVITSLEEELHDCDFFEMSVAFVTLSGIEALKGTFDYLQKKGVKGRLLTSDYLTFSDPAALKFLNSLSNLEVRMYCCKKGNDGFHTKGYIFGTGNNFHVIIGSSNLTVKALTCNREWNVRLVSNDQNEFIHELKKSFEEFWTKSYPLREVIDDYTNKYNSNQIYIADLRRLQNKKQFASFVPNEMQNKFVAACRDLIAKKQSKALLISATGTGKTYAAAFLAKTLKPRRLLFVIHREQIAKKALETFKKVLGGSDERYGLLSGHSHEDNADFLFATVQSLSKNTRLSNFKPDHFDLIFIDEVHHIAAESYQRFFRYFCPKFCLGMTASPERTDSADIFKLFDYNIAYEIRLKTAMEQDLLCPFHYFGITDIVIEHDGEYFLESVESSTQQVTCQALKGVKALASEKRVRYILEKAAYYGYSGKRIKGLVFCSSNEESKELSKSFNLAGYKTVALSAQNSEEEREDAVERLQTDDPLADKLDYIFTVDIFNEGIDIPEVNQILMLRPTKSAIVFLQQLGRGLRKSAGKDFVVILDFIGNYANNYLISVALSGDNSYNKDNMRRFTSSGAYFIPGASSIHFDEIAAQKIFSSIDKAKTNDFALLKSSYLNLKHRLGRIPKLIDFPLNNEVDPSKIFELKNGGLKYPCYPEFVESAADDFKCNLSATACSMLSYYSYLLGKGQRLTELLMLEALVKDQEPKHYALNFLKDHYDIKLSEEHFVSALKILQADFFLKKEEREKHSDCAVIDSNLQPSEYFKRSLKESLFKESLYDLIELGKYFFEHFYVKNRYLNTDLSLFCKYSYAEVCRLLNYPVNYNGGQIGGYFYEKNTKTVPIFVNYDKNEGDIAYEDRFVDEENLHWVSKTGRKPESGDADHIFKRRAEDKENRLYLFVRRNKDDHETKDFYFLGEVEAKGSPSVIEMSRNGKKVNAFSCTFRLKTPVSREIYRYLTGFGETDEKH
ncbi:MAG: DUF3427 domain-containing protein [Succinatimonas sp.]|nr:DUF3427 domain-containing protein [Succinatimonas sp.]